MIKQRELFLMSKRLKEIKNNIETFGGISIVLVGDTAQLLPVKCKCLWDRKQKKQ